MGSRLVDSRGESSTSGVRAVIPAVGDRVYVAQSDVIVRATGWPKVTHETVRSYVYAESKPCGFLSLPVDVGNGAFHAQSQCMFADEGITWARGRDNAAVMALKAAAAL